MQLLENAAKYSAPGLVIKVGARLEQQNVVISVIDEGSGLTQNEKSLIGRRSFRGDQNREFVPGSGLGLWIAHCFVAANGGVLEAEPRDGDSVRRSRSGCAPATARWSVEQY